MKRWIPAIQWMVFSLYLGAEPTPIKFSVGVIEDPRLPQIEIAEIDIIFDECNRLLLEKFDAPIVLHKAEVKKLSFETFFDFGKNKKQVEEYRVSVFNGSENKADFLKMAEASKEVTLKNLQRNSLTEGQSFFSHEKIDSYEQLRIRSLDVWYDKVQVLKTLRTSSGENLLMVPFPPWQSQYDWIYAMFYQNQFDLVITNSLIVGNMLNNPSLHSICKHSKIGGMGLMSPERKILFGHSLMINTIEFLGKIKNLSIDDSSLKSEFIYRAMGGFFLAHEFGHSFYYIPDFYDHGAECIMNSAYENMEYIDGYRKLISARGLCLKCLPWITHRHDMLRYRDLYNINQNDLNLAKEWLTCIQTTPSILSTDREVYLSNELMKILSIFSKNNDTKGMKLCLAEARRQKCTIFLDDVAKKWGWTLKQMDQFIGP